MCSCVEDTKGNRIKDFNKERGITFKKPERLRTCGDWQVLIELLKIFLKQVHMKYFSISLMIFDTIFLLLSFSNEM